MDLPVLQVLQDLLASLEPQDHEDELDLPEPVDHQETQVMPVQWDHPEVVPELKDQIQRIPLPQLKRSWEKLSQDQMEFFTISEEDHRDPKDQLGHQETQVHQDQLDPLDPLDQPVDLDQTVTSEHQGHEVHQELMEPLEHQELQEHQVNQEPKDQLEPPV
jgi:hypothetical protein